MHTHKIVLNVCTYFISSCDKVNISCEYVVA